MTMILFFMGTILAPESAQAIVLSKKCIKTQVESAFYTFHTHGTIDDTEGYKRAGDAKKRSYLQSRYLGKMLHFKWKKITRSPFRLGKRDWFKIHYTCRFKKIVCKKVKGDFTYEISSRGMNKKCIKGAKNFKRCVEYYKNKKLFPAIKKECQQHTGKFPRALTLQRRSTKHFEQLSKRGTGSTTKRVILLTKLRAIYTCHY